MISTTVQVGNYHIMKNQSLSFSDKIQVLYEIYRKTIAQSSIEAWCTEVPPAWKHRDFSRGLQGTSSSQLADPSNTQHDNLRIALEPDDANMKTPL